MSEKPWASHRLGWIGVGRMGHPLVTRLLDAGCDVAVYNRTRAKAESLVEAGATVVDSPADLADREIVFSTVSGPEDFLAVMLGAGGLLSGEGATPQVIVDCSTISAEASNAVREAARERETILLAAPVSGNGRHVARGGALFAVSGPTEAVEIVRPYLEILGRGAHHLGNDDAARLVKLAHNLFLGAIAQSLVETTLLVQSAGVSRRAYLDFINDSALGSAFSAYKAPALVELDWTPTFTTTLLRKDLELGLAAATEHSVEMPVTAVVLDQVSAAVDAGHGGEDFASMLAAQAEAVGLTLTPEVSTEPVA